MTVTKAASFTTCTFFISKRPYLSDAVTAEPILTKALAMGRSFSSVINPVTEELTFVVKSGSVPDNPFDSMLSSFWQEKKNSRGTTMSQLIKVELFWLGLMAWVKFKR